MFVIKFLEELSNKKLHLQRYIYRKYLKHEKEHIQDILVGSVAGIGFQFLCHQEKVWLSKSYFD
jgi:hypothetical protein